MPIYPNNIHFSYEIKFRKKTDYIIVQIKEFVIFSLLRLIIKYIDQMILLTDHLEPFLFVYSQSTLSLIRTEKNSEKL